MRKTREKTVENRTLINERPIRLSFSRRTINFIIHITECNIAINENRRENTAFKRRVYLFPIICAPIMFYFEIPLTTLPQNVIILFFFHICMYILAFHHIKDLKKSAADSS